MEEMIAEYQKKQAETGVKVLSVTPAPPVDAKYPVFQPVGADLTAVEALDLLLKVRRPIFNKSGQLVDGPVLTPGAAVALPFNRGKSFIYNQSAVLHRADIDMYRRAANAGGRIAQAAKLADELVRTNGSRRGVVKRMQTKLGGDHIARDYRPTASDVSRWLFIDPGVIRDNDKRTADGALGNRGRLVEETITSDSYIMRRINPLADAGLPYAFETNAKQFMPKFGDATHLAQVWYDKNTVTSERKSVPLEQKPTMVGVHALNCAKQIYHDVLDNDVDIFLDKMTKHRVLVPELYTAILKRKDEKMERTDYNTKIRPYYVYPLPTRIVMMHALAPIEYGLVMYQDNFRSGSAYHFSPFYGSAEKHLAYVKHLWTQREDTKVKFSGIFYGDDQKWFFVYPDGLVVCTLDVSSMDMSTRSDAVQHITEWALSQTAGLFGQAQSNALAYSIFLGFDINVHIGGNCVVHKTRGNNSGTAGTTTNNNHSSASMLCTCESTCEKVPENERSVKYFPKLLNKIVRKIEDIYGFIFKDVKFDTDGSYIGPKVFTTYKDYDEYARVGDLLPFLGQVLTPHKGKLLFLPENIGGLVTSLILPGGGKNPSANILERILGVFISGGWADEEINKFLRKTFDAVKDSTTRGEYDALDVLSGAEDAAELAKLIQEKIGRSSLPDDEVMFDFHTLSKPEFFAKYLKTSLTKASAPDDNQGAPAASSNEEAENVPSQTMAYLMAGMKHVSGAAATVPYSSIGQAKARNSNDKEILNERNKARIAKFEKMKLQALFYAGRAKANYEKARRGARDPRDDDFADEERDREYEEEADDEEEEVRVKRSLKTMMAGFIEKLKGKPDADDVDDATTALAINLHEMQFGNREESKY